MPQIIEDLGKPSCVMCEFLMSRVKSWLEDGHTVDELEGDLKKICSLLPGSVTVWNFEKGKRTEKYFIVMGSTNFELTFEFDTYLCRSNAIILWIHMVHWSFKSSSKKLKQLKFAKSWVCVLKMRILEIHWHRLEMRSVFKVSIPSKCRKKKIALVRLALTSLVWYLIR